MLPHVHEVGLRLPARSLELTQVTEWNNGVVHSLEDSLVAEEPLEIRVDEIPLTVSMWTPGNDLELAAGFLLTEGIIVLRDHLAKIRTVAADSAEKGNIVEVQLKDTQFSPENLQRNWRLHAAALFDVRGNLIALREDVGRHNAVDKLAGWALLEDRLPLSNFIMRVSGWGVFEIIQKALVAGFPSSRPSPLPPISRSSSAASWG